MKLEVRVRDYNGVELGDPVIMEDFGDKWTQISTVHVPYHYEADDRGTWNLDNKIEEPLHSMRVDVKVLPEPSPEQVEANGYN
jgi:hypothetical protein